MVEIFKIFLPCITRTRLGSLRTAPALYLSIGDAGEHGGRYIFLFWNHEAYVSRRLHRFLMNRRNSTLVKFLASLWVSWFQRYLFHHFVILSSSTWAAKRQKRQPAKLRETEKKTSDADASVSDTLTLIGGYLKRPRNSILLVLSIAFIEYLLHCNTPWKFFPGYNGEEFMSKVYWYIYANGIHGFCFPQYWIDVVARLSIPMAISQQISLLTYKDLLRLTV